MNEGWTLSSKDKARLDKVRDLLSKDKNPYSEISSLTLGSGEFIDKKDKQPDTKELTRKERLKKFNSKSGLSTRGSHKRVFDIPLTDKSLVINKATDAILCIACSKPIEAITSVYGRIIVKNGTYVKEWFDKVIELMRRKVIRYPEFKTGYCCESCYDYLYHQTYRDWDNNLKRGIEILDRPIMRVTESMRKNHRTVTHSVVAGIAGPRNDTEKPLSKAVVEVIVEGDDYIIGRKPRKVNRQVEKIDPKAYRYVMKGR